MQVPRVHPEGRALAPQAHSGDRAEGVSFLYKAHGASDKQLGESWHRKVCAHVCRPSSHTGGFAQW